MLGPGRKKKRKKKEKRHYVINRELFGAVLLTHFKIHYQLSRIFPTVINIHRQKANTLRSDVEWLFLRSPQMGHGQKNGDGPLRASEGALKILFPPSSPVSKCKLCGCGMLVAWSQKKHAAPDETCACSWHFLVHADLTAQVFFWGGCTL